MILLENHHRFISSKLESKESIRNVDSKFYDLGNVFYHLSSSMSKENDAYFKIKLCVNIPCYESLKSLGLLENFKRDYSDFDLDDEGKKKEGYQLIITAKIDYDKIEKEALDSIIQRLSSVKRNLLSMPFHFAFEHQDKFNQDNKGSDCKGQESQLIAIPYNENQVIYIKAYDDRVVIVFSVYFEDQTDSIIGKVFLQEFVDSRKQPQLQSAPQVYYSKELPSHLNVRSIDIRPAKVSGYVTFILFPRHIVPGPKREATISLLQTFGDYLHYHIKCSKAYLHSRLRSRVSESLKILNRAKPQSTDKKTLK